MRITSQAGDFVVDIQGIEIQDDKLVRTGKMGWWDSKIYFGSMEILTILGMMLIRPKVLLFLISFPFRVLFKVITGKAGEEEDWVEPEYIGSSTTESDSSHVKPESPEDEDSKYRPD